MNIVRTRTQIIMGINLPRETCLYFIILTKTTFKSNSFVKYFWGDNLYSINFAKTTLHLLHDGRKNKWLKADSLLFLIYDYNLVNRRICFKRLEHIGQVNLSHIKITYYTNNILEYQEANIKLQFSCRFSIRGSGEDDSWVVGVGRRPGVSFCISLLALPYIPHSKFSFFEPQLKLQQLPSSDLSPFRTHP